MVVVWLIVNPIMFREPKNDKAWATRAMLGEEMWIAKRPLDRAMALSMGATAFGLGGCGELTSDVYCRRQYARSGRWRCSWRIGARWLSTTNATAANEGDLSRREVPSTLQGEVRRIHHPGNSVNYPCRVLQASPDAISWASVA